MAHARRANPEMNLNELAQRMRLSKSAVNHRLRRLVELAEGVAQEGAQEGTQDGAQDGKDGHDDGQPDAIASGDAAATEPAPAGLGSRSA
jgi:hypothetical protein